jgi:hypothetical protein
MDDQGSYWFETTPDERRYWFIVQWGPPPRREEEQREMRSSFPPGSEDLEEIEAEVRAEQSVFGPSAEKRREIREMNQRMDAAGYAPHALSVPWWPEAECKWEYSEEPEYVLAPRLFTTRGAVEEVRREQEQNSPEAYLELVGRYEPEVVDEALDNTSPLRAAWMDIGLLLDKLEDATFLCVMVDGRLKLRQDFIEELKRS